MSVTTMTIDALCVSPFNVRQNQHDATAITGMAESLATRGQLYPLVVHPMPGTRGRRRTWGALAGGRRFRAFALLIEQGRLPKDHPIDVIVRDITDEGELRELSLAENLVRVDLRPYEVYAAVARAHASGRSLRDIADTNGQTIETVRRWARLGNLHPTVFAALEAGEISQDVARAFGATDDVALQLHAFEQFQAQASRWGNQAALVRRLLKVGDRELETLLRFVGESVYADAGGRYELDLFAEEAEQRGRVADEGLLVTLADAKRDRIRTRVRAQAGRPLRFEPAPPRQRIGNYDQGVDRALEIVAQPEHESAADAATMAWLDYEIAHLVDWARYHAEDADLSEEERARCIAAIDVHFYSLEAYRDAIEARMRLPLPDGQVYATIEIEEDGSHEVRYWWASRKDRQKAEAAARRASDSAPAPLPTPSPADPGASPAPRALRPGAAFVANDYTDGGTTRQIADAQARDDHGLTADAVQVMRSIRREMLRAALVTEAVEGLGSGVALDYLLWSLARDRLAGFVATGQNSQERGIAGLAVRDDVLSDDVRAHVGRTAAHAVWRDAVDRLKAHPAIALPDLVDAFEAYRAETPYWKREVAAIVAGCALERSAAAPGYDVPLHDHLALLCGYADDATAAALAEPTPELLALLPRARQLKQVHPHVDRAEYAGLERLKAADLPAPVVRALARAKWLHPLLRFRPRLIEIVRRESMEAAA